MRFRPLILAALIPALAACAEGEADAQKNSGPGAVPKAEAQLLADEAASSAEAGGELGDMRRAIYAMYADIDAVEMTDPPLPMTDELAGLFAAERDAVDAGGGEPNNLDMAWVIGGAQDYELGEVAVTEEPIDDAMTSLVARFTNFGEPQMVRYVLKRQGGEWLLDDIVVEGPGDDATSVADSLRGW